MARKVNKLSPAKVAALVKAGRPGLYGDGAGLGLSIGRNGAASWSYRFMTRGKAREAGLGSVNAFGLAEARERARRFRQQLADGVDPLAKREEAKRAALATVTLKEVATLYIEAHRPSWRSPVHAGQWDQSLRDYILPTLGTLAVDAIGTGDVMKVLSPIWQTKPETASRVRQRIEVLLDYGASRGWRSGDNAARWRGHLNNLLPPAAKVKAALHAARGSDGHHAALPYQDIPALMRALEAREGMAARALRWLVLTASRSGEARAMTWSEVDEKAGTWTIPAGRMKANREHRVPIGADALACLPDRGDPGEVVFGGKAGNPLSDVALAKLLPGGATIHGMRAAFRTWCSDTGKPEDLAEAALAHSQGALADAYQRGDRLDRRRVLMQAWADHCLGRKGEVVALRRAEGVA